MLDKATKEYLNDAFERLATKDDLLGVKGDITVIKDDLLGVKGDITVIKEDIKDIKADAAETKSLVNSLHVSVDTYLKRTEDWRQEFSILKARHDKLAELLAKKGVIREEELVL